MNAKNIIIAVLFLSGIFAAGEAWSMAQRHKAVHEVYSCPMHPQIKSDKPGQCPICGDPTPKLNHLQREFLSFLV